MLIHFGVSFRQNRCGGAEAFVSPGFAEHLCLDGFRGAELAKDVDQ
jgi:hypothetical protein